MKRCVCLACVCLGMVAVVVLAGCGWAKRVFKPGRSSNELAPLVVDKDAPLLLDDAAEPGDARPATKAAKENAACFVCHADYSEEFLVVEHAVGNVGCTGCHGESFAHRNDENHITPPDIMFPRKEIQAACRKCHHRHNVSAEKIAARKKQRNLENEKHLVCTDCHGNHRMKRRSVRWNKKTGELIPSDKN